MSENKNAPPVALVKTWVGLLNSNEDKVVKDRAERMLTNAFGNVQAVAAFCNEHGIQVN